MTASGGVVVETAASEAHGVGPLVRGLALLRSLSDPRRRRMSLGELARATGLARATVSRLVGTLTELDYLRWDGDAVTLAPPLAGLGEAYLASAQLPRLLAPHLDALAEELDEPVCLSVPDRDGVRIIAQANRRRGLSATFLVGDLLPPGRSAAAPLLTPDRVPAPRPGPLPRVGAAAGRPGVDWAVDDQTLEPGLIAVAVPLRAPDGQVRGAVTATSQTSRHSLASLCELALPRLRETAAVGERRYAARLAELHARRHASAPPPAAHSPRPGRPPSRDGRRQGRGTEVDGAVSPVPTPTTVAASVREVKRELGAGFLQSLARGLAVVTAFDAEHDRLTLSEVAQRTGLARATARRALLTLHQLGYVASQGRQFRLLPRLLELGYPALRRRSLAELATPHLAALAALTGQTATVSVLAGEEVRCLARADDRGAAGAVCSAPPRPAYATASGRVLLAGLPSPDRERALRRALSTAAGVGHRPGAPAEPDAELRRVWRQGYAGADADGALAAPVRNRAGRVVAAVAVAGCDTGVPAPRSALGPVLAAAARLEADLRAVGGTPWDVAEG